MLRETSNTRVGCIPICGRESWCLKLKRSQWKDPTGMSGHDNTNPWSGNYLLSKSIYNMPWYVSLCLQNDLRIRDTFTLTTNVVVVVSQHVTAHHCTTIAWNFSLANAGSWSVPRLLQQVRHLPHGFISSSHTSKKSNIRLLTVYDIFEVWTEEQFKDAQARSWAFSVAALRHACQLTGD